MPVKIYPAAIPLNWFFGAKRPIVPSEQSAFSLPS